MSASSRSGCSSGPGAGGRIYDRPGYRIIGPGLAPSHQLCSVSVEAKNIACDTAERT